MTTKAELSEKVFSELCDYFEIDADQVISMNIRLEVNRPVIVDICKFVGSEDRKFTGRGWKTENVRHTFEVVND